ncbi:MAG TPA: endonuclease III [Gemmatimonadaceae bacterium]
MAKRTGVAKDSAPRKPAAKKLPAKKSPAKKQPMKKLPAKKTPAKKAPARKRLAKRSPVGAAPARPNGTALNAHAAVVLDRLLERYPDAHCALDFRDAFELLCATILSAQCTDKRVNMVTPTLFARYPNATALAAARQEDVEEIIKSTGFFRSKAKSLIGMASALVEQHGGEVPAEMDALVRLPGVGRKTANVILGNAFGMNEGVVVDTHVTRLADRLGLTTQEDPVKIEADLMRLVPRDRWTMLSHLLIEHGRRVCEARSPKCEICPLADLCPSSRV